MWNPVPEFTRENVAAGSRLLELWLGTVNRAGYVIPPHLIGEIARLAIRVVGCPVGPKMRVPGYEPEEPDA
jgi:hypothetical protein